MLDTYRISERLSVVRSKLLLLEKDFKGQSKEKFLSDELFNSAAERNLQVAIQACIDISNHIVSALGLKKPKKDTAETFRILAVEGILTEDFAKKMVKITGYRNILVHGYLEVNREETYRNINYHLLDLAEFGKQIEEFLALREK